MKLVHLRMVEGIEMKDFGWYTLGLVVGWLLGVLFALLFMGASL